jgi:hypothetical protein
MRLARALLSCVGMTKHIDAREFPLRAGFEAGPPSAAQLELAMRALIDVMGERPSSTHVLFEVIVEAWVEAGGRGAITPFERLTAIAPVELAAREPSPALRVQLVRLAAFAVLFDRRRDRTRAERLGQLAAALAVDEPAVADVRRWVLGQPLRLRRGLITRQWSIDELRRRVGERGRLGVAWVFLNLFLRRHRNDALAAHYQALARLPADTLGAGLVAQLRGSGFALPGEPGSLEDWMVRHDLVHVFAGLGTDPRSEVEAAAFMAGCRRYDGFALIVFALLQFHCGLRMTPVAPGEHGLADPRRVLDGVRRSAFMTIDPSLLEWNYERDFAVPLARLRQRYQIAAPRHAAAPALDRAA